MYCIWDAVLNWHHARNNFNAASLVYLVMDRIAIILISISFHKQRTMKSWMKKQQNHEHLGKLNNFWIFSLIPRNIHTFRTLWYEFLVMCVIFIANAFRWARYYSACTHVSHLHTNDWIVVIYAINIETKFLAWLLLWWLILTSLDHTPHSVLHSEFVISMHWRHSIPSVILTTKQHTLKMHGSLCDDDLPVTVDVI